MQEERWWGMKTQGEYIRTLQRRVAFLKAREYRNSYDAAELGALEWALVNLPPQPASKPWVGLTDEQWQSIADTLGCIITRGQKDAIEAKLKEKNT